MSLLTARTSEMSGHESEFQYFVKSGIGIMVFVTGDNSEESAMTLERLTPKCHYLTRV